MILLGAYNVFRFSTNYVCNEISTVGIDSSFFHYEIPHRKTNTPFFYELETDEYQYNTMQRKMVLTKNAFFNLEGTLKNRRLYQMKMK